jgi:hypothetical protein
VVECGTLPEVLGVLLSGRVPEEVVRAWHRLSIRTSIKKAERLLGMESGSAYESDGE